MELAAATESVPVLIVDDDPGFRALVADVLSQAGYATTDAGTGEEAVAAARGQPPVAVVLDVCLPRISGYEVCRQLRDHHGDSLPIVFVSGERMEPLDRAAGLLVGGDDYLVKPVSPDELVGRVRRLLARARASAPVPRFGLTRREQEVLGLLADGLNQKEIARELVISAKTVAGHIQSTLEKLGVHSRAQAVSFAHREGLLKTVA